MGLELDHMNQTKCKKVSKSQSTFESADHLFETQQSTLDFSTQFTKLTVIMPADNFFAL